ncbi:MAG: ABC transporter permease, partial [Oscillospiraceae bacterium]|nr:ABC transporter permease [Oscillospiraceae bacterium]
MSKNSILARSNIRKAKGQTAAIIVLVLLASVMMNLWLMLGIDYKANFKRTHDRLNDGHVTLTFGAEDNAVDFLKGKLDNSSDVAEYCVTDTIIQNYIFFDKDTALSRNVGKYEIVEEGEYTSGIYLPIICKGDESYQTQIGYEYKIGANDNYRTYTVCGFVNSSMMGSDNCGMVGFLLTSDKYNELCDQRPLNKAVCVSIRLKDASQSRKFETEIKNTLLDEFPDMYFDSNTYEMVSTTRYVSQSISAAIICGMAFIIILIALVVISSNVVNYIKENMQNLGALKAVGYTSRQLISAQAVQFSGIALAASIVGIALTYTVFPYVADMMNAQTGIPYKVRFLLIPCLITAASVVGAVALAVYLSARSIKKIEPITALRQGISTHSFKKNHLPLEKTKIPPNAALALKTTLSGVKQNVTVCVTMLVLSLILVFAGVMYKNVIETNEPLVNLVMGVVPDYG